MKPPFNPAKARKPRRRRKPRQPIQDTMIVDWIERQMQLELPANLLWKIHHQARAGVSLRQAVGNRLKAASRQ
jgi:hypothetical protein